MRANINITRECCAVTSITGSPIREQLLGEFRDGIVVPAVRLAHAGMTTTVPVAESVRLWK